MSADAETKTRAASDFLRSSADRTNWAEQGLIFENSAIEYDDAMKQRHHNLKGELDITSSSLADDLRGLLLYHKCCNSEATSLEGREVPSHFMPGTLNAIADRHNHADSPSAVGVVFSCELATLGSTSLRSRTQGSEFRGSWYLEPRPRWALLLVPKDARFRRQPLDCILDQRCQRRLQALVERAKC